MNWNHFKNKFHPSWHEKIKPFIEGKECDEIYRFLKEQTAKGKKIAPASSNTYRAFLLTPLDEVKCVIIGGAPYDRFFQDQSIATGLFLDCSLTQKVTPQLRNFYEGIEREFYDGLQLDYIQDYSLDYLAERGVLLLNSSLTVEKDKIGGHEAIWKPFMLFLLTQVLDPKIPTICIGTIAEDYIGYSTASFYLNDIGGVGQEWDTHDVFDQVNQIIENNNQDSIMWLNIDVPF